MKRILLSIGLILFVLAILAGGTGAFLANSNTSTGNTFATGLVDLLVDNESYVTNNDGKLVFSTSTSWTLSSLAGKLFFNFLDLKPGDIGEDTISLHVNDNNAWACMNIKLTGTPENGQDAPEALVDPTTGPNDGELQNYLYFVFWADDGDNVYEQGEKVFKQGLVKDIFNGQNWSLADSQTNIWGDSGKYLPGGSTKYIGKAWCFGTMTAAPVAQDGKGKTGTNGPLVRGTGFTCNGAPVGNIAQSDGIKADINFSVSQARSNTGFVCSGGDGTPPPTATSTLFSDDFSGCQINHEFTHNTEPNWDEVGGVMGNNLGDGHGSVADLNGGGLFGGPHTETLTSTPINTQGYHTITFKYDRKTDDTNSPPFPLGSQTLTVAYSTDGGSSWTTLETVTGESAWATKTWSLSPNADNKPSVKVRFTFTGADSSNHAYIDNVSVTGVTP
jgi:hypothetical protein